MSHQCDLYDTGLYLLFGGHLLVSIISVWADTQMAETFIERVMVPEFEIVFCVFCSCPLREMNVS